MLIKVNYGDNYMYMNFNDLTFSQLKSISRMNDYYEFSKKDDSAGNKKHPLRNKIVAGLVTAGLVGSAIFGGPHAIGLHKGNKAIYENLPGSHQQQITSNYKKSELIKNDDGTSNAEQVYGPGVKYDAKTNTLINITPENSIPKHDLSVKPDFNGRWPGKGTYTKGMKKLQKLKGSENVPYYTVSDAVKDTLTTIAGYGKPRLDDHLKSLKAKSSVDTKGKGENNPPANGGTPEVKSSDSGPSTPPAGGIDYDAEIAKYNKQLEALGHKEDSKPSSNSADYDARRAASEQALKNAKDEKELALLNARVEYQNEITDSIKSVTGKISANADLKQAKRSLETQKTKTDAAIAEAQSKIAELKILQALSGTTGNQ